VGAEQLFVGIWADGERATGSSVGPDEGTGGEGRKGIREEVGGAV